MTNKFLVTLVFFVNFAVLEANCGPRLALMIGIEEYPPSIGILPAEGGPKQNAATVAQALQRLGFEIQPMLTRGRRRDLDTAIQQMLRKVEEVKPEYAFLYYAGHGVAGPSGINYIIPSDASLGDLGRASVPINDIIAQLAERAPATKHIVVIDACRNELNLTSEPGGFKGFNLIDRRSLPQNILVAFATGAGRSAANSKVYSTALVSEILKQGVALDTAFLNVQEHLRVSTKGEQIPWYVTTIKDDISLAGMNDLGAPGCCEPAGAKRLIFRGSKNAVEIFRSPDANGGILELRGNGSVLVPKSKNEVHFMRERDSLRWVVFQTDWGRGFVAASDVKVE
jgi:hypothetical protein